MYLSFGQQSFKKVFLWNSLYVDLVWFGVLFYKGFNVWLLKWKCWVPWYKRFFEHYDWVWKQGYDCFEHYEGDQDRVKILCVQYWGWKQGKTFQRKNPGELGNENVDPYFIYLLFILYTYTVNIWMESEINANVSYLLFKAFWGTYFIFKMKNHYYQQCINS